MRSHRKAAAGLTAALLAGSLCVRAGAVTVDWDDLTDAQQEQAYHQLEAENQALREQLAQLQGPEGSSSAGYAADSGTGEGTAADTGNRDSTVPGDGTAEGIGAEGTAADEHPAVQGQLKTTEEFLADLAASFNARQEAARAHTNEEVSAMSEADMWNFRFACTEVERSFYEAYHKAQFDDLNILYLCSEYCLGLEKQFQAEEIWNTQGDSEEANRLYTAGYYNRAYALVELCEYYGLDLAKEYENLKNAVVQMDSLSADETRNASVDPAKITQVQELLNSLGFLCGTPDGICGRQTVSCIERFQNMYGYEPADGMIDDELIAQLTDQLTRRQG